MRIPAGEVLKGCVRQGVPVPSVLADQSAPKPDGSPSLGRNQPKSKAPVTIDVAANESALETDLAEFRCRFREAFRNTAYGAIEMGRALIEAKDRAGYGRFKTWIASELGIDASQAQRLMRATKWADQNCPKADHWSAFQERALRLLAAKGTPEPVTMRALEQAERGEIVTEKQVRGWINEAKPTQSKPKAPKQPEPTTPQTTTVEAAPETSSAEAAMKQRQTAPVEKGEAPDARPNPTPDASAKLIAVKLAKNRDYLLEVLRLMQQHHVTVSDLIAALEAVVPEVAPANESKPTEQREAA